ncbi:MAG: hypothetical protein D6701_04685 [Gemmatimonadetes bacterium]|nr:MAG: hypothetical protein D6701_04685 [Gemmatimonadota bacterium]
MTARLVGTRRRKRSGRAQTCRRARGPVGAGVLRAGLLAALGLLFQAAGAPGSVHAQTVRLEDLVLTGGVSGEGYSGNLPAVTIPVVDSTQNASAAVGEFAGRVRLLFFPASTRQALRVTADVGMRQFAAMGFKLRDYAPREWVGLLDARYTRALGADVRLTLNTAFRGRSVEDRPPMPLFLQPGFNQYSGGVRVDVAAAHDVVFDLTLRGERADYRAIELVPQLDLLDRRTLGVEGGVRFNSGWRLYGGFDRSTYPQQGSFDERDPFRRDHTLRTGLSWNYTSESLFADVGLEGAFNRSNSRRPEYDAVSFSGTVSVPLPWWSLAATASLEITGKNYLFETEFARLVPGEEADNASIAHLTLARPIAPNLDAALRFGWTRAETDIGDSYFQRYGVTFLLNYRPF